MAEALAIVGAVASVAQLADFGCKLSIKLFAFSQTAATADEAIKAISSDVSLTSTVLQELSAIIKNDESRVISKNAIAATEQTVAECLKVFEQLDEALEKSLGNAKEKADVKDKGKGRKGLSGFEKFKWPFKQPKMDLLRSNLDRLKASLSLMLQVLSYARDVSNRKAAESSLAYQKQLIEALARSQQLTEKRYRALQMALENNDPPPAFHSFVQTSVQINSLGGAASINTSRGIPGTEAEKPNNQYVKPVNEKTQRLVSEILVLFSILDRLIDDHIASRDRTELTNIGYDQLIDATDKIRIKEYMRLKNLTGSTQLNDVDDIVYALKQRMQYVKPSVRYYHGTGVESEELPLLLPNSLVPLIKPFNRSVLVPKNDETARPAPGPPVLNPPPVDPGSNESDHELQSQLLVPGHPSIDLNTSPQPTRPSSISLPPHPHPNVEPPYDPYSENPSTRTAALQAQIDATVAVMRDNTQKVMHRGEKLDSLDSKTVPLSSQSAAYRNFRVRKSQSPWTRALNAVTAAGAVAGNGIVNAGSAGLKNLQGLGQTIAEVWGQEPEEEEDDVDDERGKKPVPGSQVYFDVDPEVYDDDEEDRENVFEDLLAKWTNLPVEKEAGEEKANGEEKEKSETT